MKMVYPTTQFGTLPDAHYAAVFFGFWLSHVPPPFFDEFWRKVRTMLRPGGTVAFVDNLYRPGKGVWPPRLPAGYVEERDLSDGSRHQIVAVYFEPSELNRRLAEAGWRTDVRAIESFFLYGSARPF